MTAPCHIVPVTLSLFAAGPATPSFQQEAVMGRACCSLGLYQTNINNKHKREVHRDQEPGKEHPAPDLTSSLRPEPRDLTLSWPKHSSQDLEIFASMTQLSWPNSTSGCAVLLPWFTVNVPKLDKNWPLQQPSAVSLPIQRQLVL